MNANGKFESFQEAFAFCRECDRPVVVEIEDIPGKYKLFPSGRAARLFSTCPDCWKDLSETIPICANGISPGCGTNWGKE